MRKHPQLSATQHMFVRTLRKAVMRKAEIAIVDARRQPPFSSIGDPETRFPPKVLRDMLFLTRHPAHAGAGRRGDDRGCVCRLVGGKFRRQMTSHRSGSDALELRQGLV